MVVAVSGTDNGQVINTVGKILARRPDLAVLYDPPTEGLRAGTYTQLAESSLHPHVLDFLARDYANGLFRHQHGAIESILAGQNTVLATRTSSGKSLIYALPVFDALCRDPNATALFLYPQKALANDQLTKLRYMGVGTSTISEILQDRPLAISRYDGSTPHNQRPLIRREAQVLLTNPEMLHLGIMQHHDRHWSRFFANLRLVAVDECHEYRGVFGTNVAYVLRRLRQLCLIHGSDPRFVATSATVQDPQEHMERLTGVDFRCVGPDQDGSLQGRRKFWMVTGNEHYYDTGRKLACSLAEQGLTVLAFCPTRVAAERMVARLPKTMRDESTYVRVYRSGLLAEERETIEDGLRDRSIRLVFSTSALELGIDIGEIDVVVCIGLPGSLMSLWQRAGRAARGGREGATVLIPADSPIDTYYASHPEVFFSRDQEPLALNLENQRIACQHYACAVQEVGGDEDRLRLGTAGPEMAQVHQLRSQGKLNGDEFYRADPHAEVNIRSAGEGNYSLMVGEKAIGEIDSFHLLRESYRNAIYRHGGQAYRVKDVIRGRKIVSLQREYSKSETFPFVQKKIRLRQQMDVAEYSSLRIATVAIDVTEFLVSVTEKGPNGKTARTWQGSMGMPAHQLPTEGTMILLKADLWAVLTANLGAAAAGTLRSSERLLCSLFPTISGPCDLNDFSSGTDQLATGEYAIFLYDLIYGGVDLTRTAFDRIHSLVEKALERLDECSCEGDEGCLRCIANPRNDVQVSKAATRQVLAAIHRVLLQETPANPRSRQEWSLRIGQEPSVMCGICGTDLPPGVRFCLNCGEKQEN